MSTGSAATNNITYGVNANAMVLNHNEVIEVVINNFDGGWHPIHIHGHAPQLGESRPIPLSIKLANSHSRSCERHIYTFRGLSSIPARYTEPWAADGLYECSGLRITYSITISSYATRYVARCSKWIYSH
jgi:FtsP/CotA-like multicopper oxidase with cupredoxin domain